MSLKDLPSTHLETASNPMTMSTELILKCAQMSKDVYSCDGEWVSCLDHDAKTFFLAIQGTNEVGDWKTNLSFLFKSEDTHDGFKRNAWKIAVDVLLSGCLRDIENDYRIVLTGHSLGGATAIVLLDLLQNYYTRLALVTFGAPRPGGRLLRKRVCSYPHYRFVHGSDIVPLTPPATGGYVHTHQPIILGRMSEGAWDPIKDHAVDLYIRALMNGYASLSLD